MTRFLKTLLLRRDYDHDAHMAALKTVKKAVVDNKLARRELRRVLEIDIGRELDRMGGEPTAGPWKNGKHR